MSKKQTVIRCAAAVTTTGLIGLTMAACQVSGATTATGGSPTASPAPTAAQGNPSAGSAGSAANVAGSETGAASGNGNGNGNGSTPACASSQIHVTSVGKGAAMSHTGLVLVFTNTSAHTCSLTGYAGAALTYADGHDWNASREMNAYLGGDNTDKTPQTVVLKPGAAASDLLSWTVLAPAGDSCQGAGSTELLITTPGTTETQSIAKGESGACAYFDISPVVPGSTGSK